ncbi:MAG: hypothetical protein JKY93_01675 [Gammaproteobacteria bacterium]|nr:hypothetical protein [Gammaproteobacteria bacterium]
MSDKKDDTEDKNSQTIEIEIEDRDFKFNVTRPDYNDCVNQLATAKSKVATMHNFLMLTIDESNKSDLRQILKDNPGSETQIFQAVYNEYVPDLAIVAKKRKR